LDFIGLAAPLLYFVSFGAVLALLVSAVAVIIWVSLTLWRRLIGALRRALKE
jgi:hypothetical protein